ILGGVIVEANHHVIDGSIRSRLEYLRKELRK
ncbi:MAG TPA: F0F1 ATP synthase subunit delta, partial [Enterococcus sp.]|nr:F0F1 ATP synthase subunit delta [Enterococcus sp.]